MNTPTWESIVWRDPYLAGSIAARGWKWWQERTPEQTADAVGLQGEQRQKFLEGWTFEVAEQERERKAQRARETEALLDIAEEQVMRKGDPANW